MLCHCLLQVLSQPGAQDKGFDRSIFIDPKMLHLTLLMLKLYSDEARHKARTVLQGLAPQVRRVVRLCLSVLCNAFSAVVLQEALGCRKLHFMPTKSQRMMWTGILSGSCKAS